MERRRIGRIAARQCGGGRRRWLTARCSGLGRVVPAIVLAGLSVLWGAGHAAATPIIGYVYTNNGTYLNSVRAFGVHADASLTELPGSPFSTGGNGGGGFFAADRTGISVIPGSHRLYVTDAASATVSAFNIASNGTLTAVAGSPFGTGLLDPESLAVNSTGTCLFVAEAGSGGGIVPYHVNADGSLGMPLAKVNTGGTSVDDLQFTAAGTFLAASLPVANSVAIFTVGAGCSLTPVAGSGLATPGLFPAPSELTGLRFNKIGSLLFGGIANSFNTQVAVFSVPFAFAQIPNSPFSFDSGANSNVVLLNPDETKLYVSNQISNSITVLDVAAGGALSLAAIPGNPFPLPGAYLATAMAMDPDGTVLLVASGNGVHSFAAAMDGTLSPAPGSPVFVYTSYLRSLAFTSGGQAQGTQCGADTDCATGSCTDGVCCNSACGGNDLNDCQACSVAAGAPSDGTCAPLTGTTCDDGNFCTTDVCASGTCVGTPVADDTACDDGNNCTDTDVCTGGHCGGTNLPDDTPCDDGDLCTQTDQCEAGQCTGSNPVICPTPDQCHDVPACDPSTGVCSNPLLPDLTSCDDGDICTTDYCFSGVCSAYSPRYGTLYVDVAGSDAGNDCTNALSPCATIQHGVDAACTADTVRVQAGTYQENVVVPKEVTILGGGRDVTIVEPATSNPDCGGSGGGDPLCSGGSSVFLVQTNGFVEIDFLTVEGDNPQLTSGVVRGGADIDARNGIIATDPAGGLLVQAVAVRDVYLRGIEALGQYFFGQSNSLTNIRGDDAFSIAMSSRGSGNVGYARYNFISDVSEAIHFGHSFYLDIPGNSISHAGVGVFLDGIGDAGGQSSSLHDNTVQDCVATSAMPSDVGILLFSPYSQVSVGGNTVTNCAMGLVQYGSGNPNPPSFYNNTVDGRSAPGSVCALVSTHTLGMDSSNATADFVFNDLRNCETGLAVQQQNGYTATVNAVQNTFEGNSGSAVDAGAGGATLSCNLITGNTTGVAAQTAAVGAHDNVIVDNGLGADGTLIPTGSMSATQNWWGCVSGPGSAGCDTVAGSVDVVPPLTAAPACVYCNASSDCDDGLACNGAETCNGTCRAGTAPTCALPAGVDVRCNAPACVEPSGACTVQQFPDGMPCNHGDDCQQGVCTGPNSLNLKAARLRHSHSATRGDGNVRVRAMLNDNSTGGTLWDNLKAGTVTMDVYDAGTFRVKIPLTGCKAASLAMTCRSHTFHIRASFRQLGKDLPKVYTVQVSQQKLDRAHTGSAKPIGPVTVVLHQNLVDRGATLVASKCRASTSGALVCQAS
jgi:6-phosphogluconolactonase (cycloisomerase 2 family)